MKKNKSMRIASVLLVVAILTTSILSGTFAKYITGGAGDDSARVAKFGVVIAMNGDLYGDAYGAVGNATAPNQVIAYGTKGSGTGTVQADTEGEKVVAPGTKSNKGLGFSLTGAPEVDVTVDATLEVQNVFLKAGSYAVMAPAANVTAENYVADTYYILNGSDYELDDTDAFDAGATYFQAVDVTTVAADYYPVVYAMTGSALTGDNTTDSLDAIAAEFAKTLNGNTAITPTVDANGVSTYTISKTYKANTDLATAFAASNKVLSWEWDFDDSTAGTFDGADTILGDLAAGVTVVKTTDSGATYTAPTIVTDYILNTAVDFSVSVTQID